MTKAAEEHAALKQSINSLKYEKEQVEVEFRNLTMKYTETL